MSKVKVPVKPDTVSVAVTVTLVGPAFGVVLMILTLPLESTVIPAGGDEEVIE